jgi:hypothetical protein
MWIVHIYTAGGRVSPERKKLMIEKVGNGAMILNYADDLVVCCKARADEALGGMRRVMGQLQVTINEEKTRICPVVEAERVPETRDMTYVVIHEIPDEGSSFQGGLSPGEVRGQDSARSERLTLAPPPGGEVGCSLVS